MAEFAFPLAAGMLLFLVAIPTTTVLCKVLLLAIRPERTPLGLLQEGSSWRYLLLTAPVTLPTTLLLSSLAHHAEARRAVLTCLFDHLADTSCGEPTALAGGIALALAATLARRALLATRAVGRSLSALDTSAEQRLFRACASQGALRQLRSAPRLIKGVDIRTVGLLHPSVEVGALLVHQLDRDTLMGALLHEEAHVQGYDPLRFTVLSMLQNINPMSSLIEDDVVRWRRGREAVCDDVAVRSGADPLCLAEALVYAARPEAPMCAAAGLAGSDMDALRMRVNLLMSYNHTQLRSDRIGWVAGGAILAAALCVALPHVVGAGAMIELHLGSERLALRVLAN